MSRVSASEDLLAPFLDRLIDLDPSETKEVRSGRVRLAELRRMVRRDVEDLLNSRATFSTAIEQYPELLNSLANYGIPDFTGGNLSAAQDPTVVFQAIERAIERFEVRLVNVKVRPAEAPEAVDRTLRFQIDATLYVDPYQERVRFNTEFDPSTNTVLVKMNDRS